MVEEIYKKFEKKRAETLRQPEFKEKEITKEKERDLLVEAMSEYLEKAPAPSPAQQKVVAQKAQQIKAQPKERQVQLLTGLAFEKGVSHAIEVAKRLDNPYILDEFHDALVDELYNKLIESGRLKAI